MFYLLIVLFLSLSIGALYFKKEDMSWLKAYKTALEMFVNWFSVPSQPIQPIEYNPNGDYVLGDKLRKALAKFDVRPAEYIACSSCYYSTYNLPCVCLDFIPKNGENDFPAVKATMNAVFAEHMQKCGFYLFYCNTFIEPVDNVTYYVYIVYATTEQSANNYKKYFIFQSKAVNNHAKKAVTPIVDEELEQELEEMENNEQHNN